MTERTPPRRSPAAFFGLLVAMALPIWLLSRYVGVIGSLKVPVTDLLLGFTPLTAAAILVCREEGAGGLAVLFRRAFGLQDAPRPPWLFVVVLLAPLIYVLTDVALVLAGGAGPAPPQLLRLSVLAVVIFLLAIGEEVGWTGYATDPLQARWGALGASLIIAVPWWLGHLPSILEIGGTAADIAWWIPGAIGLRILMLWLFNNTGGSLFSAVLFHTLLNVGRLAAYPAVGSHFDRSHQAVGYAIVFAMALIVLFVWGPRTMTGRRDAPPRASAP